MTGDATRFATGAAGPLLAVLRDPARLDGLDLAGWDAVLRQARHENLIGRVADLARRRGLDDSLPAPVRARLDAHRVVTDKQAAEVRWEARQIAAALAATGVRPVMLKGAAYLLAGLPAAAGRLFSDVDFLVPKDRLAEVEGALLAGGWVSDKTDPYDQRYYRVWMHELPPLRHLRRQTHIDVHHRILPETARLRPDPAKMRAAARPLDDPPGIAVPAPADMVLHSAAHLFHDEDFVQGLRDLVDLDLLLRHFGADAGFWPALTARAVELDLAYPLFLAFRHAARVLGTPVPDDAAAAVAKARPDPVRLALMDALLAPAFTPDPPGRRRPARRIALFPLYLRSHWLRMPARLLIPHLARKAVRALAAKEEDGEMVPIRL